MKLIRLSDVSVDGGKGVRLSCPGHSSAFLVPFNRGQPDVCMASHLINYMDVMQKNLPR